MSAHTTTSEFPTSKLEFQIRFYSQVIIQGRLTAVERKIYQAKLDALVDLFYAESDSSEEE